MNWDLATEEPNRVGQFGQFGNLSVNATRKDPKCRVVAVSGLASNPHWEWTSYSPETRIACNWLSELLPQHARGAVIETFRYNLLPGSIGGFLSEEGLTSAANRLLRMLDRSSASRMTAPIIFVAHDLGGIVVKKALLIAHEKERFQHIARQAKRIIFFGTPHRALDEGSWEDLLLSIILASPAKLRMVPSLATRLGPLSRFLEGVSCDFLNVAVDCRFINIYQEVDGESRGQPVLPPYSATMGVVHENIVGRQRNHEDLATFSSDKDPAFLEIAIVIRAETNAQFRSHLNFFARWLPSSELFQNHNDNLHRFLELSQWKRPKNGTKPETLAYLDDHFAKHDTLLAIGEGPLDAKALYQCLKISNRPVLYYAHSDRHVKMKFPNSLWGTLIYQLLSHEPYLYTYIEAISTATTKSSAWTARNVAKLFRRLLANIVPLSAKDSEKVHLHILLENLPLRNPVWQHSLEILRSLQDTADARTLEENPSRISVKLVILYNRHTMDGGPVDNTPWAGEEVVDPVSVFGKEPLRKFAKALAGTSFNRKHRAQYESLILDQCGYDAEVINALHSIVDKDPDNRTHVILDSTTKEVIWETIARNVEEAFRTSPPIIKVAIGWLVHTLKPFTQEELWSGVQLSTNERRIPPMVPALRAIYGRLIYATNKRICFPNKAIHGYFRDCLSKEEARLGPKWAELHIPDQNAIADILIDCIAEENSLLKTPTSILHLKSYASEFWRMHVEKAPADVSRIRSLAENRDFMQIQRKMEHNFYWARFSRTRKLRMDGPLVLAVQAGTLDIVTNILRETTNAKEVASAVSMAARYNHGDIAEALLATHKPLDDVEANKAIDAALEIAAVRNCSEVYKPVLSWMEKYAADRPKEYHAKLLSHVASYAAMFGYLDLLKLVVESHGAEVDKAVDGGMRPLWQAVTYGNAGCVRFLVQQAGAVIYDTNHLLESDQSHDTMSMGSEEGQDDGNPLIIAAEKSSTEILTILLDRTVIQIDGPTNGATTVSGEDAGDANDASEDGDTGGTENTEKGKGSRRKSLVPWSFIEDALISACKKGTIETVKHILEHPTVKAVPKSHRRANSELLSSAVGAQMNPGADSLAMLILKSWEAAKSRDDLIYPFVRAAEFGQLEFVRYCLELDDPNAAMAFTNGSDADDRMALHCAANQGHNDIVRCLLEQNADPNVADGSGYTPLALAAVSGHAETVELLLINGADVSWVGPTTKGILALATVSRACELDVSVIRLLLKYGASVNALDGSKHTALHWAAQRGHVNILEVLLAQDGIDVTITGDRDMNALHSAAQSTARTAVVAAEMLIAAGISTQKADVDGWLPLHLAACWNGVDLMQFLLGNDKNGLDARTTNGDTVLHTAYKTCEVLIWLLDQGFDVDIENNEGRTVLMHAARNGLDDSVGLLLAFGASTDSLDRSNRSALHHAVETRSLTVANKLLDANPAVLFQVDSLGMSVLYTAIMRVLMPFALRVLNELEKYAKENDMEDDMIRILNAETANTQGSPLVLAARRGDEAVVAKMVELGADIEKRDYNQLTPLTYAIQKNNGTIARLLLEAHHKLNKERSKTREERKVAAGNDKDEQSDDSAEPEDEAGARAKLHPAPLQSAAAAGSVEMVELLLRYDVDVNEESGQFNTALTAAASGGFSQVVSILLDHKADPALGGGSYPNALSAAVSSASTATIDLLLAKNKSAVLARDIQGRNALHVAIQSRALDAFEKILSVAESLSNGGEAMPFGTALDPDKQGRRLLHFAASSGDVDTVRYFLEHPRLKLKNEIDILDNDGWTPLHWACRLEEGAEVVGLLLEHGSDPSLETRDGWTPLNIAQYHDAVETLPVINLALHNLALQIAERRASSRVRDRGKDENGDRNESRQEVLTMDMETGEIRPIDRDWARESSRERVSTMSVLDRRDREVGERPRERPRPEDSSREEIVDWAVEPDRPQRRRREEPRDPDLDLDLKRDITIREISKRLAPGYSHWGVTCDGCFLMPSIGPCFTCEDCADYDFCFKCHWSAKSTHYAGHKWKLRDGTEDPGDNRRPPYGAREVNRIRSRVRSRESPVMTIDRRFDR